MRLAITIDMTTGVYTDIIMGMTIGVYAEIMCMDTEVCGHDHRSFCSVCDGMARGVFLAVIKGMATGV
jgi:hypothetical protein